MVRECCDLMPFIYFVGIPYKFIKPNDKIVIAVKNVGIFIKCYAKIIIVSLKIGSVLLDANCIFTVFEFVVDVVLLSFAIRGRIACI